MGDVRAYTTEDYLTVLRGELRLRTRHADRVVGEVRDHLQDVTESLLASGASRVEAEERATARFGDPAELARGLETRGRLLFEEAVRTFLLTLLGMCVAAGIGVSGLLVDAPEGRSQALFMLVALGAILYLPFGLLLRFVERRRRLAARPVPRWIGAWNGTGWEVTPRVLGAMALLVFVVGPRAFEPLPPDVRSALLLATLALAVAALPLAVALRARRHGGRRTLLSPPRVHRLGIVAAIIAVVALCYLAVVLATGSRTFWGPVINAGTAAFLAGLTVTGLDFLRRPHMDPRYAGSPSPRSTNLLGGLGLAVSATVTGGAMVAAALFTVVPVGLGLAMAALDDYSEDKAVTLTRCRATSPSAVAVNLTIVNADDQAHTYVVSVMLREDGELLRKTPMGSSQIVGTIEVPVGETETLRITRVVSDPLPDDFTCTLESVSTMKGF